jgi:NitT/TauT family transport system substrate-binding protein
MDSSFSRSSFLAGTAAVALTTGVARAQAAPVSWHLAGSVNDDVTPMLYALASGLMKRAGFDLTVDKGTSGSAVSAGVVGGAYQIGKSSVAGLITAHAKGVPFVFVAPGGLYESTAPVTALMVRADSAVKTGADLNGKIVAVSAIGDLYTLTVKGWVDQHGGDSTTLKLVEIPLSAVPAALAAGRIDAGCLEEPEVSEALAGGTSRVLGRLFDSIAPRFMYTGWFSTLDFATQNRALLDKFRGALREATNYTNAHKADTVDLSSKFTLIDPKIVAKGIRVTAALTLDPKLLQPVIEASAKYKTIPASFDARDMIDPALR